MLTLNLLINKLTTLIKDFALNSQVYGEHFQGAIHIKTVGVVRPQTVAH